MTENLGYRVLMFEYSSCLMQDKIEALTSKIKLSRLKELCRELSERYRKGISPYLETEEHRTAYLVTRFPATFAAVQKALSEISHLPIESLLDLGSGPGTGYGAAKTIFPDLKTATCVESDTSFIRLGKRIFSNDPVQWIQKDLKNSFDLSQHDLVLMSYSLGEIPQMHWERILTEGWKAARQALVIVEPGTPLGFKRIRDMREKLLLLGAHMIAPCPHANACPMKEGDWCHFAARVQRTSLHRQVKEGELGFEDEKFSYIIVGKEPSPLPGGRILRYPLKQKGHVSLTLCTLEGIKNKVVTRKEKDLYKKSRKLSWGGKLIDNNI